MASQKTGLMTSQKTGQAHGHPSYLYRLLPLYRVGDGEAATGGVPGDGEGATDATAQNLGVFWLERIASVSRPQAIFKAESEWTAMQCCVSARPRNAVLPSVSWRHCSVPPTLYRP
jgi:hypothetical protein